VQLDSRTRQAINESFLLNVHAGKPATVSEVMKDFYGKETEQKRSYINSIFRSAAKPKTPS